MDYLKYSLFYQNRCLFMLLNENGNLDIFGGPLFGDTVYVALSILLQIGSSDRRGDETVNFGVRKSQVTHHQS